LYIAALLGAQKSATTSIIHNAVFTSSGQYNPAASNTAYGFIDAATSLTELHTSGVVTGVGGKYNPTGGGASSNVYKIQDANDWGTFLNQYGIWGDLNRSGSFSLTFTFEVDKADTYTFVASATSAASVGGTGTLSFTRTKFNSTANSVAIISNYGGGPKTTTSNTMALAVGTHTFSIATTTAAGYPGAVAIVAKDSDGEIVYQSTSPPASSYNDVAQEILMPKGGAWFTGVTKLALDANASDKKDYYVGAKLSIQSKYVYSYTVETATYVPPPPPRRGGRCFTEDTLVLMADGTEKKIKDVKVGDIIFNRNKKMLNVVMFVEKTLDTHFMELYSPNKKLKPFATINHPIYIGDDLCSPISEEIYNLYPWLGKTKQIDNVVRTPAKGNIVYNLWVDGDGTFIVNGYGTTSIIGDGGILRKITEKGLFTEQEASNVLVNMATTDKETCYGAYIMNKLFANTDIEFINQIFVKALKNDNHPKTQKFVFKAFKLIGKIACIINNK
jgi:hypothetical protein